MKVLLIGPVSDYDSKDSGYGNISSGFLQVLNMMKLNRDISDIKVINTNKLNAGLLYASEIYDVGILIINPNSLLQKNIQDMIKFILSKATKRYLNVLWETIPLPSKWDFIWGNDLFSGYIVSSYFLGSQILQKTEKPVYYLPPYIDGLDFDLIDIEKKEKEKFFTVLYVGQNTKRKGIEDTIIAYSRIFDGYTDIRLILKAYSLSSKEIDLEKLIYHTAITNMSCKNAYIYSLNDNLSNKEMLDLYRSSSVLFFPSRGEGIGLPPLEAMFVGLPVIYTNWSGLSENCDIDTNIAIDYIVDEAQGMFHHGYEHGSKYAVPIISSAMSALKTMYDKWNRGKKQYYSDAQGNRDIIKNKFKFDNVSSCFKNIFKDTGDFAPEEIFDSELLDKKIQEYKEIVNK